MKSVNEESREMFQDMFERHDAVMLLIDSVDGIIVGANKSAATFYGYSRSDLCSMKIQQINQSSPEQIEAAMLSTQEKNRNYFVFPHRLASGEVRTVEVYSTPINDGEGKILFSIIHDITERKQAEEELRKSEMDLKKAQAIAHLGSWEWDIVNDTIKWSDETYKIFGLTFQDFHASYENLQKLIHPDDRIMHQKTVGNALHGKDKHDFDYRIIRPDGQEKILHSKGEIIRDENGTPIIMRGTTQDITERKQAEKELNKYRYHLEELVANRTKERDQKTLHLEESNITLKVLLQQREEDKKEIKKKMLHNIEKLVFPYLDKLKIRMSEFEEYAYLEVIESNLKEMILPLALSSSGNLSKLTPAEIQIADLVRKGKTTKEIAKLLKLSPTTIATHRQNIRKKLTLTNKKMNLRTILATNQ